MATAPSRFEPIGETAHERVRHCIKGQRDANRVVEHFDLDIHFDGVFGVRTDAERRDKAALVARILADRGIDPTSAAMIGDRSTDILDFVILVRHLQALPLATSCSGSSGERATRSAAPRRASPGSRGASSSCSVTCPSCRSAP